MREKSKMLGFGHRQLYAAFTKQRKQEQGYQCGVNKTVSSILDILNLRFTLDLQVEISASRR